MKVIVAGLPKTGTKSLNAALTQLGYKVYDVPEHFWFAGSQWNKILTVGGSFKEIKEIYEEVDAVCDIPASYFWDELSKLFPDAKIILTTRDEDSWWESIQNQHRVYRKKHMFKLSSLLTWTGFSLWRFVSRMGVVVFGNNEGFLEYLTSSQCELDERRSKIVFRRHNAYVEQMAPDDKLLVYDVKEGWIPLCRFLGVELPTIPFPHENVRGNQIEKIMKEHLLGKRIIKELAFSLVVMSGLSVVLLYKLHHTFIV